MKSDLPSLAAIVRYLLNLPWICDAAIVFIGKVDIMPLPPKCGQQARGVRVIDVGFEQKMGFILIPLR
jgi:hypothetical protein